MDFSDSEIRAMITAGTVSGIFIVRAIWLYLNPKKAEPTVIEAQLVEDDKP